MYINKLLKQKEPEDAEIDGKDQIEINVDSIKEKFVEKLE